MNKWFTVVDNVLIVCGVTIALVDIQTILGIIILAFQVILIIYRLVRGIIEHYKNKEYDKIETDIQNGIEQIQNLSDSVKNNGNKQSSK